MRPAVFALIAILGTVFVDERHHHELDIVAQPGPEFGLGQHGVQNSLQHIAGHHLRRMVARREPDAVLGRTGDAADARPLHRAAFRRGAERAGFDEGAARRMPRQERFPVALRVDHAHGEPDLLRVRREGVGEGARGEAVRRVAPRPALVERDARAARADRIAVGEAERQGAPGGAAGAEGPVEPPARRVAQLILQIDRVAFHAFQQNIAGRQILVDHEPRIRVYTAGPESGHVVGLRQAVQRRVCASHHFHRIDLTVCARRPGPQRNPGCIQI
ncbi:MAG: hypothetical protein BWX70_02626 [Verrucomicrobia bacterium ADurb.Bin070]|nr:MAG: hypothetical protein BWX70_02626 [Verrucomicrobia bacterium ADurb.Bin070]